MFSQDDFRAFIRYANRERSLDASVNAAPEHKRSEDHVASVRVLRELNKKMLFRETNGNGPLRD